MSRTSCDIFFDDNPSRVFYGGQLLSGRVVLKLYKEKTVRGIYVKIVGRAYCRWTTGSGDNKKTHIGEEYYLNEKTFFVGGENGQGTTRSSGAGVMNKGVAKVLKKKALAVGRCFTGSVRRANPIPSLLEKYRKYLTAWLKCKVVGNIYSAKRVSLKN